MEVSGQLHASTAFPLVQAHPVPVFRRLCGSQCQSIHCGEDRNLIFLPEIEP